MRSLRIPSSVLALLLGCCAILPAQVPGIDLQLVPKIGAFLPLGSIFETTVANRTISPQFQSALAIGLALEIDVPLSPVNFRVNLESASTSVATGDPTIAGFDARLLAVVGDLVFRPASRLAPAQPYLLAGLGIKAYDFEADAADTRIRPFFEDRTDFAVHLGAGLDVRLGPVSLVGEIGDYLSWFRPAEAFERRMQNDLFLMLGLRVGMF